MSIRGRYLCFDLGPESFAIPLLIVREVLGVPPVTRIPQTPPHFLGIMNLRGQIVTLLDLRIKLGLKALSTSETAVVILDLEGQGIGMVVDSVVSVQELAEADVTAKPSLESTKANEFITGVFKRNDKLILILDVSAALSLEDRAAVKKMKAA